MYPSKTKDSQKITMQYFQALGVIRGDVSLDDSGDLYISIFYKKAVEHTRALVEEKFLLQIASGKAHIYNALKKDIVNHGGTDRRLLVYPKIIHLPKKEAPYVIKFLLAGFEPQVGDVPEVYSELQDFCFKIAGFYQFIPVCRTPCISVMRNATEEAIEKIKSIEDEDFKKKGCKGSHLPIVFKNIEEKPFRFNPKSPSTAERKFISLVAILNFEHRKFYVTKRNTKFLSGKSIPKYLSFKKKQKTKAKPVTQRDKSAPKPVKLVKKATPKPIKKTA